MLFRSRMTYHFYTLMFIDNGHRHAPYNISSILFFIYHRVLQLFMFLLQERSSVAELIFYTQGLSHNDDITRAAHTNRQTCRNDDRCKDWRCDDCDHTRTISVIVVLGTARFADHILHRFSMTRGLTFSPTTFGCSPIAFGCSPTMFMGSPTTLGDSSTLLHAMLGDCSDCSPTTAQGLSSSTTCDSHTVEGHLFFFRPCYKAHATPSSKLGDYIGTMHLTVHAVLWLSFLFRPWHHMSTPPATRLGD